LGVRIILVLRRRIVEHVLFLILHLFSTEQVHLNNK
jgi:hypothetical protein